MGNPLLEIKTLPEFSKIKPEAIEPALDVILSENREKIKNLLTQGTYTWDNLLRPLEDLEDRLDAMWSAANHLNSVKNTEEIREAYNACLPKLTQYGTEISHNRELYEAIKSLKDSTEFEKLNIQQQKVITNALRDFHLAGVDLNKKDKERFAQLQQKLSSLTTKFEENVLDATHGWHYHVTDEKYLSGLTEHAIATAKQVAEEKNLEGWVFTLDAPAYIAVMKYTDSRSLREDMYHAFVTRASELGPNAGQWDNSQIMEDILAVRYELAKLLGFDNCAERSLVKKMAEDPSQVLAFLKELADAAFPKAKEQYAELCAFAKEEYQATHLQPWDIAYYAEKLRHHLFDFTQEELRPYFPEPQVVQGLFEVAYRLYGISIKENKNIDTWHENVKFFEIYDKKNQLRGQFYLDLYARRKKRGGAWMDECRVRRLLDNEKVQIPVAFLTCNFNPPVGNDPALLTHDEVLTLFHEFGHGLQHMLTQVDYADISGINGVPWDAVELPSQFMENWCWEKEGLDLIAKHYQTGEPLSEELLKKMRAAKNFHSAMQMVRQLEFGLFDFRLHLEYKPGVKNQIQSVLDDVRAKVSVTPLVDYNRFQHSFSHIFAGGYSAGYYSYMWADVLASDAFEKFKEEGIFNQETGQSFMKHILETGGSEEPMVLFKRFRGREPRIDALLKQNGICEEK